MSQDMINIGGDENDINYRYKMHRLQTKVEGRGNGIKTVLVNITDVAKELHTEPQYITRYFASEVGAVSQWDKKRNAGIVNGVHQSKDLQNILKRFNNDFILCPQCKLPELQMKVDSEKSILWQRCNSCGWKGKNASTHRVKTYIINNPPPSKKKIVEDAKNTKTKATAATSTTASAAASTSASTTDVNEKQTFNGNIRGDLGGSDDTKWSVDISDEAVNNRKEHEMKSLPSRKPELNPNENDEKSDNENEDQGESKKSSNVNPYQTNKKYVDEGPAFVLRQYLLNSKRTPVEILDEIKRLALSRNLDDDKVMKVIFEGLCQMDDHEKFIESLKKYARIISNFTKTPKDCQIFFSCLEEILARRNKNLLSKTYLILNVLYDEDIVNEEQILNWYHAPLKNSIIEKDEVEEIRKIAQPFIKWLEEDASENDGENNDNNDKNDENDENDENDNNANKVEDK